MPLVLYFPLSVVEAFPFERRAYPLFLPLTAHLRRWNVLGKHDKVPYVQHLLQGASSRGKAVLALSSRHARTARRSHRNGDSSRPPRMAYRGFGHHLPRRLDGSVAVSSTFPLTSSPLLSPLSLSPPLPISISVSTDFHAPFSASSTLLCSTHTSCCSSSEGSVRYLVGRQRRARPPTRAI